MAVRVQEAATLSRDDICCYTHNQSGEAQADRYITGMFEAFERIERNGVVLPPIPAEFRVEGFFFWYERHSVYWRRLSDGDIGIAAILDEGMRQID